MKRRSYNKRRVCGRESQCEGPWGGGLLVVFRNNKCLECSKQKEMGSGSGALEAKSRTVNFLLSRSGYRVLSRQEI